MTELLHDLGWSALFSSAALLAIFAVRKPMRIYFGAHVTYALWALVPLAAAMALIPAPTATLNIATLPGQPATFEAIPTMIGATSHFDPMPWVTAAWIAGAVLALTLLVLQQRRFMRALGNLSAVDADIVRAETTAGCPALIGAWKPRVVLPSDFEQRYSRTERDLILAHEQAHRTRGDAQVNLLAAAVRCVFWFNPLVYFAASRFRFDQELACDALVMARFPGTRRSYADAMLKTQLADFGLPVGCYWQSSHPLKERIAMLKNPLPGPARAALGFGIAAALIVGGSYAAWASQPPTLVAAAQTEGSAMLAEIGASKASYRGLKRINYPPVALAARIEGVVYVKAHVGVDGKVANASADHTDPSGSTALVDAAVDSVKNWTFEPAKKDGKPVESDEIIPIVFSLAPDHARRVSGGTLDAIRVGPPAEPKAAAVDSPATENVAYRNMFPPEYPKSAIDKHQSGKLVFKVLIDEHGAPQSVEVERADPPEAAQIFEQSGKDAIMQWKFNPPLKDGKPFAGYALVPIDYSLTKDG